MFAVCKIKLKPKTVEKSHIVTLSTGSHLWQCKTYLFVYSWVQNDKIVFFFNMLVNKVTVIEFIATILQG